MTPIDLFKAGVAFGVSLYVYVKRTLILKNKGGREMQYFLMGTVVGIVACLVSELTQNPSRSYR
ncbi:MULTISPECIES: hypothetical protein [Bacillus amyloliquefaciens group]|uniref:hypothetical protein n=1 Tax=Bacillus amyloliquefaciens group TaxID=1938374 RepID=UPI001363B73E|nr:MULTISPECIES: hypothetical protein [Bacillus amyloliquefaciens group]MBO3652447.1 hypothetical protein [Bacillus amyloliquefaciens]MCJ2176511.1 hypothetical protein [Bacillus amyloliquefaciens]MCR4352023.1 hypothetical protein [Bacillus amyloliquefaciens]MCR4359024.1 hypothetical protein [Bacillus amyloliquefaciens]MDX7984979.1 hypothetical protein [Bacillus velezensis]